MDDLLFKILIRKMRAWQIRTRSTGKPIVLKGVEGEIIMELLEAAVKTQDNFFYPIPFIGRGAVFFNGSPVYCEHELSTQHNTYHGYIS